MAQNSPSSPAKAAPAAAAPVPAAPAAVAAPAPVPSAPAKPAPVPIKSSEKPTHETDSQSLRAAREAFFKVKAPGEVKTPSADDKGASAPVAGEKQAAPAGEAGAAAETEVVEGLVYEAPGTAAPAGDGGSESTFTLPEWTSKITDPESRAEAEKFARNEWEQTQKLKRQRGEAQAETAKEKQEREALESRLKEYQQAATPVAAPELVLPAIRTESELEAFVASAPKSLNEHATHLNNIKLVLDGLKENDEFTAFGRTFKQGDLEAIEKQQLDTWQAYQQLSADMEDIPAKREWLAKRKEVMAKLPKGYEKQFTAGTAENAARLKLLDPKQGGAASLDAHPNAPVLIGDYLTMEMVRAGKLKLVKASAPQTPLKVVERADSPPAGSRDAAAPVPRSEQQQQEADIATLKKRADEGDDRARKQLHILYAKAA